jgi:hypothetical protein
VIDTGVVPLRHYLKAVAIVEGIVARNH